MRILARIRPWLLEVRPEAALPLCRFPEAFSAHFRQQLRGDLELLFPGREPGILDSIIAGLTVRLAQFRIYDRLLERRQYDTLLKLVEWPELGSLLQEQRRRPVILSMWHAGPIYTVVWGCHNLGLPVFAMVGGFRPEMQMGGKVKLVSLSAADQAGQGRALMIKEALQSLEDGQLVLLSADHAVGGRPLSFLGAVQLGSAALPVLAKRSGAAVFPITARCLPDGRRRVELGPELSGSEDVLRAVADYHEQWLLRHPEEIRFDRLKLMAKYIRDHGRLNS
jgi:lauroyl/myristoyl acyltransferase